MIIEFTAISSKQSFFSISSDQVAAVAIPFKSMEHKVYIQ